MISFGLGSSFPGFEDSLRTLDFIFFSQSSVRTVIKFYKPSGSGVCHQSLCGGLTPPELTAARKVFANSRPLLFIFIIHQDPRGNGEAAQSRLDGPWDRVGVDL